MKRKKNVRLLWLAVLATVSACVLTVTLGSCSQQQDTGEYDSGYEAGYAAGQEEGYQAAYDEGYEAGYQSGHDAGYDDGHDEGYREGHYDGEEEGREAGYRSAVDDLAGGDVSQEYYPDKTPEDLGIGTSQSYNYTDYVSETSQSNTQQPADTWTPPTDRWVPSWTDPDQTVYVSNRSHTIHSINNCSGMKNYIEMTFWRAVEAGYEFCLNCW